MRPFIIDFVLALVFIFGGAVLSMLSISGIGVWFGSVIILIGVYLLYSSIERICNHV